MSHMLLLILLYCFLNAFSNCVRNCTSYSWISYNGLLWYECQIICSKTLEIYYLSKSVTLEKPKTFSLYVAFLFQKTIERSQNRDKWKVSAKTKQIPPTWCFLSQNGMLETMLYKQLKFLQFWLISLSFLVSLWY